MTEVLPTRSDRIGAAATGYGLAVLTLPILTLTDSPTRRDVVTVVAAVLVATLLAWLYGRWASTRATCWLGPPVVGLAGVLYAVTPAGLATALIALLVGGGVGLACVDWPARRPRASLGIGAIGGLATLGIAWGLGSGPRPGYAVGAVMTIVPVAVTLLRPSESGSPSRSHAHRGGRGVRRGMTAFAVVGSVAFVAWTGANNPDLSWFGKVDNLVPNAHGKVALTFDDGPNEHYSLQVRDILDRYGVRGTFFMVGKAVDARPEIAKQMMEDGRHIIGNHSYHHDYWRWLDPTYPELDATQKAIKDAVGVCPRFFRPPHGQRTPLMEKQVSDDDMRTVTWDESGADWDSHDAQLVADRIIRRARSGSIILLHDGYDGDVVSQQPKVLVQALPKIIEGLRAKGLEPVGLDKLLGVSPYLERC